MLTLAPPLTSAYFVVPETKVCLIRLGDVQSMETNVLLTSPLAGTVARAGRPHVPRVLICLVRYRRQVQPGSVRLFFPEVLSPLREWLKTYLLHRARILATEETFTHPTHGEILDHEHKLEKEQV